MRHRNRFSDRARLASGLLWLVAACAADPTHPPTGSSIAGQLALQLSSGTAAEVTLAACSTGDPAQLDGAVTLQVSDGSALIDAPAGIYCHVLLLQRDGSTTDFPDYTFWIEVGKPALLFLDLEQQGIYVTTAEREDAAARSVVDDARLGIESFVGYNTSMASLYAQDNWNRPSGWLPGFNPFPKYGSNCTNFVSQAVLGGLLGTRSATDAWNRRATYWDKSGSFWWYFNTTSDYAHAWTVAKDFVAYAKAQNSTSIPGLNFTFITRDDASYYLNYNSVRVGDVIFVDDHTDDGTFTNYTHMVIVTQIVSSASGYDKIRVTGNTKDYVNKSLNTINLEGNYKYGFGVWRPLGFTKV